MLSSQQSMRPGSTRPRGRFSIFSIILLLGIAAIACWGFGVAQRGGVAQLLQNVVSPLPLSPTLADAQNGVVLIKESQGSSGRIMALKSGQASWLLVSGDDTSAISPALAPDGRWVSYVSSLDNGKIVVVSLTDDARLEINRKDIQDALPQQAQAALSMEICSWSSTSWAPESSQVAFFACDQKQPYSTVVVASIPTRTLTFPSEGAAASAASRQALWLDDQSLVVTTPVSGTQPSMSVKTIPVQ